MSSVATAPAEYKPAAAPAPAPPNQEGGMMAWIKSHAYALADQILISGTNFATFVLVARVLDKGEFGIFSSIYSLLLVANIFQTTLITQAHNVLGATRHGEDYRRYTTSSAVGQLLLIALLAAVAIPLALVGWSRGWSFTGMLVALIPAIVFWQLQEFIRRVLYTEHRHGAALAGDVIAYGGQTAAVVFMYAAHFAWGWKFTGAMALYALAGACAAGVLLGVWQIRHSLARHFHTRDLIENWHFGKWLVGGDLFQYCSSIHMQVLWATWLLGAASSADLRAAQILYGPARMFTFFLGNVLPIRFARTLHAKGTKALKSQIKHVYLVLIPTVGAYCLLLVVFPRPLLKLIYRTEYANSEAVLILMLYSLCAFISYMQTVVQAALTAARRTRPIFAANFWGCVIALLASPICIKLFGSGGSVVSMILATLAVTALFIHAFRLVMRQGVAPAAETIPPAEDVIVSATAAEAAADVKASEARGVLLGRVLELLERNGVSYCILHGYQNLPRQVFDDVDMLLPRDAMPRRLAELLRNNQDTLDADVVQWFSDGAHFIVLAGRARNGQPPTMLQLHVSCDYVVNGRIVFSGNEVLGSRRQAKAGFWVPGAEVEFAAVLANRIDKQKLTPAHARRLSELWTEESDRCRQQLARLFSSPSVEKIAAAAQSGEWSPVVDSSNALRVELLDELAQGQRMGLALRGFASQFRRVVRWARPRNGLHIVFLGPDGAGKSTVIDAVRERIAPAFLETQYQTFARGILGTRPKKSPHELPVRSLGGSLVKAGWWLLCYGPGFYGSIHPTKARGGLAINHRYLIDAIVDPGRYRYGGPTKIVRWIWTIVPKPDLIIVLDAPVEVLAKRKNEVEPQQLGKLRDGYVALAATLPNAHVISADQPLENTLGDVTELVLSHMSRRVNERRSLR